MSQRLEFVELATRPGVNFRQLCRRFGISAKAGYKWRKRYLTGGKEALLDRSRRPKRSPKLCSEGNAAKVIAVRQENPTWGGRKLRRRLKDLGHTEVPSISTCTEVLRRAHLIPPVGPTTTRPFQRFERAYPNELWQLDFKGHFATQAGPRCHPLTVLDDHSRFNLVLSAEANETGATVKSALTAAFRQYGLPEALLCDNGAPWGTASSSCRHTPLTVWLLQLGIHVYHGRPYHPQTQGKEERFHRTLNNDLITKHTWRDLAHCAELFVPYRNKYNCERPHQSIDDDTPVSRYRSSPRELSANLPRVEYDADTIVRPGRTNGVIMFKGQTWYVGKAFAGLPLGLRPSAQADGQWEVFFAQHRLGALDLTSEPRPKHTSRSIYSTTLTS